MTKILNSNQARAVEAAIVSGAEFFVFNWDGGVTVATLSHEMLYLYRLGPGGAGETYTATEFINAYTFLL